jgi:GDP/UDP-N,N'-diacetylbacillosamine 2-epimerase (hydrolysing)
MPNADTDGRVLIGMIEKFVRRHRNAHVFNSLGQLRYFSLMALADGVVGNSSSGLIEAPCFRKGTINIGDRQRGRLKALSVIDCEPESQAISDALEQLYSIDFQDGLDEVINPYGTAGASGKIVTSIKGFDLDNVQKKAFYNLPG